MTDFASGYVRMMQDFVQGSTSTVDFVIAFLDKFKNETREIAEDEFEILDELFGDADAYTSDANLIAENPSFYIDEGQLKETVSMAMKKLNLLVPDLQ
jgi:hypothetical protein